ncbi:hypothetical protein JW960_09625 [candidate division KSB1 bacterium]|nr:hypothetical protein [candidate division KSB1 bacterium]
MNSNIRVKLIIFLLMIVSALTYSCRSEKIASQRPGTPIQIDGNQSEWGQVLQYNEDDNFSFGVVNDDTCIYVCLVSSDINLKRQILMSGLIVWFKPKGDDENQFGLKYPVGMVGQGRPPEMRRDESPTGDRVIRDERMLAIVNNLPPDVIILDAKGNEVDRQTISTLEGIDVCVGDNAGVIVYELKIPYGMDAKAQYAIFTPSASTIELGFETPKFERPRRGDRPEMDRDGMRGGGMPGGMGRGDRGPGGPGGPGGRRSMQMPEPLKKWVTVQLSK